MVPVLTGQSKTVYENDTAVSWEMIGFRAVRQGDFKLVWLPIPYGNNDWQLYNLSNDPAELHDLSEELPERRNAMIEIWDRYAEEVGVVLPPGGAMQFEMDTPPIP